MKRSRFVGVMIAVMIIALMTTCAWASVIRVKTDGSDANNGSSWALAKQTIPGAFAVAAAGDEIWVKAGTYTQKGNVPTGIGFYGGFAGTETERIQRNWKYNEVIISGYGYFYINDPNGVTIFDGFTVSDGTYYVGAGILVSGSPTISHCKFIDNHAMYTGGAISCGAGAAKIVNNIFGGNSAGYDGGAIYCSSTSNAIITNNLFRANGAQRGGGIFISAGSAPIISNNDFALDNGGSMYAVTGALPELHHNGYYYFGYAGPIYVGLEPGEGDFSHDYWDGNLHTSPLVDKGWDNAPGMPDLDMKGQPRISGTVDVGTDEVLIAYVSGTTDAVGSIGDDTNSGDSWSEAKRTIQAAIDSVTVPAWIKVKHGTYVENLTVPAGISLEGGYIGYEKVYNIRHYPTYIDGNYQGPVISIGPSNGGYESYIYGLRIVHGYNSDYDAGGAIEAYNCSPIIQSNTLKDNTCNGILVAGDSDDYTPRIESNFIWMSSGNGIRFSGCSDDSGVINNTVVGTNHSGISLEEDAHPIVKNNLIVTSIEYGIVADSTSSPAVMEYNNIWGNNDNYSDWFDNNPSVHATDISADPKFEFNSDYPDELHISSASPCYNAGHSTNYNYNSPTDIDGQSRVSRTYVDIGADECRVMFVKTNGDDEYPWSTGDDWYLANASIQGAISRVGTDWDAGTIYADPIEIWVENGTYYGSADVPCEAKIYGGFIGTETQLAQRDWVNNVTTLDGNGSDTTISLVDNSLLDGFTVTGAAGDMNFYGAGVKLWGSAAAVHNTIIGNACCGIWAEGYYTSAPPTIQNNFLEYNDGAAILVSGYSNTNNPVVANNTAYENGYGIFCLDHAHVKIVNNIFQGCQTNGMYADDTSAPNMIANNCLYDNADNYCSYIDSLTWLLGNDIFADPVLMYDLHIGYASPCRGAANSTYAPADDIDGQTRVSPKDIGADEYNQ